VHTPSPSMFDYILSVFFIISGLVPNVFKDTTVCALFILSFVGYVGELMFWIVNYNTTIEDNNTAVQNEIYRLTRRLEAAEVREQALRKRFTGLNQLLNQPKPDECRVCGLRFANRTDLFQRHFNEYPNHIE
jgi:hypothetical protein